MSDITRILNSIEQGDPKAAEKLLPLVYTELRKLARAKVAKEQPGQTLQATALVHEAYLRLIGNASREWQNSRHFFGAAAEAMRRIFIEAAHRKARHKHGGDLERLNIDDVEIPAGSDPERLIAVNDALDRLSINDAEKAQVVKLNFFGGLGNRQVGEILGLSERTVERHWAYAKAWLFQEIGK